MHHVVALLSLVIASSGFAQAPKDSVRYARLLDQAATAKDPVVAKAAMEEAVKLYGDDGDLWSSLGRARLKAKEYDRAIEALQTAQKLGGFANKFKAGILYDLSCAYTQKGDTQSGLKFLKASLDAGFRDLQHVRNDKDLAPLHSDPSWEELAATKDVTKMTRDEGWRYDLWLLYRETSRIHINPYTRYTKAEEDAWVKKLHDAIPKMSDREIEVAFMKYMRRLNDGHSRIRFPRPPGPATLPMDIFWFEEGMYIESADPSLKELLGAKVEKVAGVPIDEVVSKIDEIASRDNPQGLRALAPKYIVIPAVMQGLGLKTPDDRLTLTVVDANGQTRDVEVKGVIDPKPATWIAFKPHADPDSPRYLQHKEKPYWFEVIPGTKTVYFQYNAVQNDPAEDTDHFAKRLFETFENSDVDRLIVDVRWNGGGNSFLNLPIVNGIIGCRKIQAPGHLFVITGRGTFSAAQNFTTDIGRACNPIYVGEPTGSSPNFVGESIAFTLPYSKMAGTVSDLYWQRSWPMDARTWIAPNLPAPPSFEAYKAGHDPAMDAIEEYLKG